MAIYNPAFAAALNAAATKLDWSTVFQNGLPAPRRIRMFRDANANAADPSVTGTEFLNVGTTGSLVLSAGNIVNFGVLAGVTVNHAADVSTGACMLTIESGGNVVKFSLGLTGSGKEYMLSANPTGGANMGIAFSSGAGLRAPVMLDSGTGPLSPAPDANTPAYVVIEDWTTGAGVEVGRIPFNTRLPNLVFDHPDYAANMGDVRVTQSDTMVPFGGFEFGATLWAITPTINSEASVPWYQVGLAWKPDANNWPGYPRLSGYKTGTRTLTVNGVAVTAAYGVSNTFAPPFKAKVYTAANVLLHTFDMPRDHLPINDPSLSDVASATKPVRPHTHCASMLVWNSARPKLSTKTGKYVPGVHARSLAPSMAKQHASFNGLNPMSWDQQANGFGHWYAAPKWAQPCTAAILSADTFRANDPYLYNITGDGSAWGTADPWTRVQAWYGVAPGDVSYLTSGAAINVGWGYEPGGFCLHDVQSWAGGSRVDRAVIPTPIMIHMTNPSWVHMRDQTTIDDMIWDWNMGYFNHAWHTITDAKTFASIPVDEVINDMWADGESHYASNPSYTSGGTAYAISQFQRAQISDGSGGLTHDQIEGNAPHNNQWVDTNFRMPFNGSAIDNLHNYQNPGLVARLYNSPAHAFSAKLRYLRSIMCQTGDVAAGGNVRNYFLIRIHAWRMDQHDEAWSLSSDHPLSIPRATVEKRIVAELTAVYNQMYVPIFQNNGQDNYSKAVRTFGVPLDLDQNNGKYTASFSLTFYMAMALQKWKQSGLFNRMWNYSAATQGALTAIIKALDAGGIAFFTEINGMHVGLGGGEYGGGPSMFNNTTGDICTSWTDYVTNSLGFAPGSVGPADFVHDPSGNLVVPDSGEHLRAQWPLIRKYYFSDIPCDFDVNLAVTRVQGYAAAWDARIATMEGNGTAKTDITNASWWMFPHLGEPLPPTELGA